MSEHSDPENKAEDQSVQEQESGPQEARGAAPDEGSIPMAIEEPPAETEGEAIGGPTAASGEGAVRPDPSAPGAESAGPPEPPSPGGEPKGEARREPSALSRFLRSALRWVTAFVVVFALGVLATWITRVRPERRAMDELRVERDSILARAEELDARLGSLEGENSQLQDQVSSLQAELASQAAEREQAQNHLALLQVLVDVNSAQLAVAQEEPAQAKAALATTDDRLAALEEQADTASRSQFQDLRERLGLALQSIGQDDFAAQRDLEVLANKLLTLEGQLFGE
jgi:hypothetical protein